MRELAKRARREDLPDPMANPHSPMGAAAAEHWPQWARYVLFGGFFAGLGAFAVFLGLERWRRATFVLGLTMVYLGIIRQYLPDSLIGIFSVRSRKFDLIFSSLLGLGLIFVSVSVDSLTG